MTWVVAVQILVAAGLGAALGLERELSSQPAGLRTHMLVALGSALFTLVGTHTLGADPTRIAAQVVTGIGFLGGGAIVRAGTTLRGLTTAASLWVTAAIGLAVGLRAWFGAALATVLALVVLGGMRRVESGFLPRRRGLEATLTLSAGAALDRVEEAVRSVLPAVTVLRITYTAAGHSLVVASRPSRGESLAATAERLRNVPGVAGVELSA